MDEEILVGDQEYNEQALDTLIRWIFNPVLWAKEAMGWDGVKGPELSNQQIEFLDVLGEMVRAKMKYRDILIHKWEMFGLKVREKELISKIGISVMSGKGTGKDAILALAIIWFLTCFNQCKSPITGPSFDQVRDILLSEIHKWIHFVDPKTGKPICIYYDQIEVQKDKVFFKPRGGESSFFKVRTASKDATTEEAQKNVLDGWHEEYMLAAVDEAAGVPDGVLKSFDTTLTKPVNLVALIFNPTRRSGYAYETHFGKRIKDFVQLHWDSRKSSIVTPEHLKRMEGTYGKDGPEYRINVMGLPPEDDPSSLIPYSWCQDAVDRYERNQGFVSDLPAIMGVDPAREGSDFTSLYIRQGRRVIFRERIKEINSINLGDWVLGKMGLFDVYVGFIDTIGIGGPIYDYLTRYTAKIRPCDVAKSSTKARFERLRDELWWLLRKDFEDGLMEIPYDPILKNQLSTIRYEIKPDGKTKVESKKSLRDRGFPSPNDADALMMTKLANDDAMAVAKDEEIDEDYRDKTKSTRSKYGWMEI